MTTKDSQTSQKGDFLVVAGQVQKVTHRALDGIKITLIGQMDLNRPYTSIGRISLAGHLHELSSGDLRYGEEWASSLGIKKFTEEYSLQRGRLRIGEADIVDTSLQGVSNARSIRVTERLMTAVWQGSGHSLCTHFYQARTADAIRLFDALEITDHDNGISIAPKRGKRAVISEPASIAKEIPGLGLLEITALNRASARRLPRWSGTKLPTGELFQDTLEDGSTYFVFATSTVLATVMPDGDEVRRAPAMLSELTVQVVT